jgi:4-hydroxy-4-methyl-2-oxoglutarate aldolase
MVCIPAEIVHEVAERAVAAMTTESLVRRAILDGMDPQDAYLKHGKF